MIVQECHLFLFKYFHYFSGVVAFITSLQVRHGHISCKGRFGEILAEKMPEAWMNIFFI